MTNSWQPLVKAINGLISDLRISAAAQQAFLANAAHQIRTPLAGVQTQLELAVEEVPVEFRARIAQSRDATRRLGHLAHQLLALARSGADANIVHEWRRVDLAALLEEVTPEFLDLALARGIDLGIEAQPVSVSGSHWLLRELLGNLLDNAIRYSVAGCRVTARCGRDEAGQVWLEVEDDGPGIPDQERELVFQRFYRGGAKQPDGAGLGLAIVHEVADRHGAAITFEQPSGNTGTRLRLSFVETGPIADDTDARGYMNLLVRRTGVSGASDLSVNRRRWRNR